MIWAATHLGIWRAATLAAGIAGLVGAASAACDGARERVRIGAIGDRLEVGLADGRILRLAGLDVGKAGGEAKARLSEAWAGREAEAAILAPKPDRWGRFPADLGAPDAPSAAIDLIGRGLARVRPEFETRACEPERLSAESAARASSRGLWNEPESVIDAGDTDALAAADGRFAIVEGVVRRVGGGRSRVYLDFGPRRTFTVTIAKKAGPAFQRRGIALSDLAGSAIRVRGVLENRFGPRMEIADPWMIERLQPGQGSKPGG